MSTAPQSIVSLLETGTDESDVGRFGAQILVLDGTSHDGDFTNTLGRCIDENVGGGSGALRHIALDVTGSDLQIPDLTVGRDDPAAPVVADVTVRDIDLVQVHAIQEQSNPSIVIEVTLGDDDVSVALDQVDAVKGRADGNPGDGELHGSLSFDSR